MPNIDDLRRRIYALSNPETEIKGDAWESTTLIGEPNPVACDEGGTCRVTAQDAAGPDRWPEAIPLAKAVVWPHRLLLAEPELAGADLRFAFLPRERVELWGGSRSPGRKGFHDWTAADQRHMIGVADDLSPDELARVLCHELGHARHAHYLGDAYRRYARDRTRPEARAKAAENDPELRAAVRGAITPMGRPSADPFAPVPRAERIIRRDERTAITRIKG